ncbi:hypothetical protein SVAN01_10989 [Stagonosporopsis vannaccii]|nr:hypothetical protein SVAN01_10989 [Stagonosporopsis vannaccii]
MMNTFSRLLLARLPRSHKIKLSSGGQKSFIELPNEIRITIYHLIAIEGFLLDVPHARYLDFLISCKQSAPKCPTNQCALQSPHIHSSACRKPDAQTRSLCLLRTPSSSSLSNLHISTSSAIPSSPFQQVTDLASFAPVLELHLSILTILILPEYSGEAPTYNEFLPFVTRMAAFLLPASVSKITTGRLIGVSPPFAPARARRHFPVHGMQRQNDHVACFGNGSRGSYGPRVQVDGDEGEPAARGEYAQNARVGDDRKCGERRRHCAKTSVPLEENGAVPPRQVQEG